MGAAPRGETEVTTTVLVVPRDVLLTPVTIVAGPGGLAAEFEFGAGNVPAAIPDGWTAPCDGATVVLVAGVNNRGISTVMATELAIPRRPAAPASQITTAVSVTSPRRRFWPSVVGSCKRPGICESRRTSSCDSVCCPSWMSEPYLHRRPRLTHFA